MAYPGIWTPWAQVLCLQCHGPQLRGREGHVGGYAARDEAREADHTWRCDECGRTTSLIGGRDEAGDWSEVDVLAELRDRLRDAGVAAEMEQTGGMCCAVAVGLFRVYSSDEVEGEFGVTRYSSAEMDDWSDAIRGDVAADAVVEFLKREVTR